MNRRNFNLSCMAGFFARFFKHKKLPDGIIGVAKEDQGEFVTIHMMNSGAVFRFVAAGHIMPGSHVVTNGKQAQAANKYSFTAIRLEGLAITYGTTLHSARDGQLVEVVIE